MAASLSTVRSSANDGASGAGVLLGTHVGARSFKPQPFSPLVRLLSCHPSNGAQASKEEKAAGVLAVPSTLVRILNPPVPYQ